ncbi:hypothetical protein AB0G02_24575 [Actinosynnema sp. NPDC023658]|uniref:hypothetical protein n=1 Tax=Actinosynnema sp. NPDC023658 TaxID=3155465 RepID=UPI0034093667
MVFLSHRRKAEHHAWVQVIRPAVLSAQRDRVWSSSPATETARPGALTAHAEEERMRFAITLVTTAAIIASAVSVIAAVPAYADSASCRVLADGYDNYCVTRAISVAPTDIFTWPRLAVRSGTGCS